MKLLTHYLNAQNVQKPEDRNWRENYINDSLFYSSRATHYTRQTYPSSLHYHEYYELVIFLEGDIHYICESESFHPQYGDIILIPPRKLHMSMIDGEETLYRRHVFYLYPDAFDALGCGALSGFLTEEHLLTALGERDRYQLISLLSRLEVTLRMESSCAQALALGYILEIFYLLNQERTQQKRPEASLPENVRAIQQYLNEHFMEIRNVSEVAEHFYYSREYVSRLFKQAFNTTVADYIMTRRVAYSQSLIAQGLPLSDICYKAGFGNLTTFIRSFHTVAHMTPSQYRKTLEKQELS